MIEFTYQYCKVTPWNGTPGDLPLIRQNIAGWCVNKLFVFKSLLTMPSNVLPSHLYNGSYFFFQKLGKNNWHIFKNKIPLLEPQKTLRSLLLVRMLIQLPLEAPPRPLVNPMRPLMLLRLVMRLQRLVRLEKLRLNCRWRLKNFWLSRKRIVLFWTRFSDSPPYIWLMDPFQCLLIIQECLILILREGKLSICSMHS